MNLDCQTLPLMSTCQQAHVENSNVLYGDNTSRFDDISYERGYQLVFGVFESRPLHRAIFHFYPFLSVIGRAKRMEFGLKLYTYTFFACLGEDTVLDTKYHPGFSVASSISNALDFLSQSHRLQSLVLSFQGSYWGMARFSFRLSKDNELYRSPTQYQAIRKLKCCVDMDGLYEVDDAIHEKAVDNYHESRVELAAAYALESERIASSSTKEWLAE